MYLQLVLMVAVCVREVAELLGHAEAVVHEFWRHKVLSGLDTAVEVTNLRQRAHTLNNCFCLTTSQHHILSRPHTLHINYKCY